MDDLEVDWGDHSPSDVGNHPPVRRGSPRDGRRSSGTGRAGVARRSRSGFPRCEQPRLGPVVAAGQERRGIEDSKLVVHMIRTPIDSNGDTRLFKSPMSDPRSSALKLSVMIRIATPFRWASRMTSASRSSVMVKTQMSTDWIHFSLFFPDLNTFGGISFWGCIDYREVLATTLIVIAESFNLIFLTKLYSPCPNSQRGNGFQFHDFNSRISLCIYLSYFEFDGCGIRIQFCGCRSFFFLSGKSEQRRKSSSLSMGRECRKQCLRGMD